MQTPDVQEARGEDGSGVPCRDDGVGLAVADRADGPDERRVGLAADRLGGLVVHLDHLGRDDVLEAVRVEPAGPKTIGVISAVAASTAPATISSGAMVASEGVHGDPDAH